MAELIDTLTRLIEPEAKALGFDLVRVSVFGGTSDPTLQVMAERPDTRQLTIDDCAALSRRLSELLDALEAQGRDPIDHAYRLEVSSPGIDRPLTRLKDYADWAGHEARIMLAEKLNGQKQFKGALVGVEGDQVSIRARDGAVHTLPFAAIEDAKLVLTDKLIAATAPLATEGAEEFQTDTEDMEG
ncbi:ribosome maturation protein RimP [Sphingomonas sp. GlSt437]|uniref:ribosome maturation protein RimP n=1 Tax=Sphingomonas sp. GlSt437 TaxID=3389970 RepID=UPI003A8A1AE0